MGKSVTPAIGANTTALGSTCRPMFSVRFTGEKACSVD